METKGKYHHFYRDLAARFRRDVVGNKLYLDPHFTLDAAAGRQGVTRHDLPHAVTRCLGKSFCRLVNELRIADAVLDRIVHHSLRVELFGESIRKRKSKNENAYG